MAVDALPASVRDELAALEFTYAEVGQTAGELPAGYGHVRRSRTLPAGVDFDGAAQAVMTWRVQVRAGLRVAASSSVASVGSVVLLRIGMGLISVSAPCRVVYVVDEPDRRGFAYGTLPGHPESGEESFILTRLPDGTLKFDVVAFSRPQTILARLGGPIGRLVQRLVTRRYLHALEPA